MINTVGLGVNFVGRPESQVHWVDHCFYMLINGQTMLSLTTQWIHISSLYYPYAVKYYD